MKHIIIFLALLGLSLTACKKETNEPVAPQVSEIVVGEADETEIVLDKGNTVDKALSGGNGKFAVTVQDSKIVEAKIEGTYLKIKGLNYGTTTISLRSHDKQKTLTIRVERPALSLSETEVMLYPSEIRKNITVRGGGDDVEYELVNPEEAVEFRWEGNGTFELVGKHEGEAKIIFKTKDDKPATEMKIVVKAKNDVSRKIGFYVTTSQELREDFPVLLHAHRPGKKVWISGSTNVTNQAKKRVILPSLKAPVKGQELNIPITFVSVGDYAPAEYPVIVEEVLPTEGLVTLRGRGFKIVAPYDL